MSTTPTGPESVPLNLARLALKICPTFWTWIGATGTDEQKAAAANARIHDVVAPEEFDLPLIILDFFEFRAESLSVGVSSIEGILEIVFMSNISETDDAEAAIAFMSNAGSVLMEFLSLCRAPGYLNVSKVERKKKPSRPSEDEEAIIGKQYMVVYQITFWGAGG